MIKLGTLNIDDDRLQSECIACHERLTNPITREWSDHREACPMVLREWSDGDDFELVLWDTGTDLHGKSRLGYRFWDRRSDFGDEPIFEGTDFSCSPCHAIDSDATIAALLGFLSLRPGDTDQEYFEHYSPEQVAWAIDRGEYLALLAYELEEACEK